MATTHVSISIPKTFGALLLGALFASLLSGSVFLQVLVYFKLYPSDSRRLKVLVIAIWLLDTLHTICIWVTLWNYLIVNFGDIPALDNIYWSLALAIQFPSILTLLVQTFFAQRIFMLSRRNYILAVPIVILAVVRCAVGVVASVYMLYARTFTKFRHDIYWIGLVGLGLSSAIDIMITTSLFILLYRSRTGEPRLDGLINALIRYSFETAALTCAGSIAAMLCWVTMKNAIWLGLHFVLGKLYASCLLITLNIRKSVRQAHTEREGKHGLRVVAPYRSDPHNNSDSVPSSTAVTSDSAQKEFRLTSPTVAPTFQEGMKVTIERTVHSEIS